MEVDMVICATDNKCALLQSQSEDATVSSSSFGDSFSNVGNHESDNEVVSQVRGDHEPKRGFWKSGDLFPGRKKRVTSHWRKYIHPVMWRCKWAELQIKKFQSLAIKYDEELIKHDQARKLKYRNFELQGLCSRSMPFIHDFPREKLMKRKIRKRIEESDVEGYLSQHNLFSFLGTYRTPNDAVSIVDEQTNSDDYSLEQMLWKIEVARSQADMMKARLNTVITENAARFSSADDSSLLESNDVVKLKPQNEDPNHGKGTRLQEDVNELTEHPPATSRKRRAAISRC